MRLLLTLLLCLTAIGPMVIPAGGPMVVAQDKEYKPAYQEMIPMGAGDRTELSGSHGEENWLAVSSSYKDIPVFEDRLSTEAIKKVPGVVLNSRDNSLTIDPKAPMLGWTSGHVISVTSGEYELYGEELYQSKLSTSRVSETRAKFQDYVSGTGIDLYELEDPPQAKITNLEASTIHSIDSLEVMFTLVGGKARTVIGVSGKNYYGDWGNPNTIYSTNPSTGLPWTFAELEKLQAGVELNNGSVSFVKTRIKMGIGSQTFYPITPVEVTPGTASAWVDVDVSAYVPAGATGVILHLVLTHPTSDYGIGIRKNGSVDSRTNKLVVLDHCGAAMGVDSNRVFEAYIGSATYIDIYLVGYTMSGVTFFTNAYNKSLVATGSWTDIDCAVEAPGAIGLIFETIDDYGNALGLRVNGSTDNRIDITYRHSSFGVIIGCDASRIAEGYISDVDTDFFLVGYITEGATFYTNATNISTTTGGWKDLTALPAGSVMGFIEVVGQDFTYTYGLRPNGSSENIQGKKWHPWAFVACDTSGIIEGVINNNNVDFFLVGYATKPIIIDPPVGLTLTYLNNTTVELSWTLGVGAVNTMVRRTMGRVPVDRNDGALIYYGTGLSANDTGLDAELITGDVVYRAFSQAADGAWEEEGISNTLEESTPMTILALVTAFGILITLGFIFKQPLLFVLSGFTGVATGVLLLANYRPVTVGLITTYDPKWVMGWVMTLVGMICFIYSPLIHSKNKFKEEQEEEERLSKLPKPVDEDEAYSRMLDKELSNRRN